MSLDDRVFQFRPLPSRSVPDETRLFTTRMRRALRAAHGLGVVIRLQWFSGSEASVAVTVPTGVGVRWLQFGLTGAYELGQWQATDSPEVLGSLRPCFSVAASGPAELPFPSAPDLAPWSETVLAELGAISEATAVRWNLVPDATIARERRVPSSVSPTPPLELRTRTLPERALLDNAEYRRTGLRWRVEGDVLGAPGPEGCGAASRISHLLETASHLDGGNGFRCRPATSLRSRLASGAVLSEAELVGLFPPSKSISMRPSGVENSDGPRVWLGRDLRGSLAGLPIAPSEGRHLLVLGETGMGKSSLVVRLAWQAIHLGNVILFDPVGDMARGFLAGLTEARATTVSWVSPAVPGLTLGLLGEIETSSGGDPARRERLVGDVVAALRKVRAGRYTESSFWGPRLEEMLSQALRAASQWPGASLAMAERLLSPGGWVSRPVPAPARAAVADIRRRIEFAPQDGDGARRLLSEITHSEALSRMLDDDAPTWSTSVSLTKGRTTVVSGDAPKVGEPVARYLLAVVLALVWNAVLGQVQPQKTFLILDEAQWYAHDTIAEMLRLGRRFNLHVWAATQSLRSLPESVREALVTNSADVVLFRGAPDEVRDFARWVPELAPERIMRMPRGEAAVLIGKGSATHWVHLDPPGETRGDPNWFAPKAHEAEPREQIGDPVAPALPRTDSHEPSWSERIALAGSPLGEVLRALAQNGGIAEEITVRLTSIRSNWPGGTPAAEESVRWGGRALASAGILVRSGKDRDGRFWVLSRKRLEESLGPQPSSVGGTSLAEEGPDSARKGSIQAGE